MSATAAAPAPAPLPRLSGFIRRFGRVSLKEPQDEGPLTVEEKEHREHALLKRRRELQRKKEEDGSRLWSQLKQLLAKTEAEKILADFRQDVKEIVGTDSSSLLLDDASVRLFRTCLKTPQCSHHFHQQLSSQSGCPHTYAQAERLWRRVHDAAAKLDEKQSERLDRLLVRRGGGGHAHANGHAQPAPFGQSIRFEPARPAPSSPDDPAFALLTDLRDRDFSLRNEMTFDLQAAGMQKALSQATANGAGVKRDVGWMEEKIKQYYGSECPAGLSLAEFSLSLVSLLSTKRSSDELQTELFDLIGFERIELVETLLEHRQEIARSHAQNKHVLRQEIASAAAAVQQQELIDRPSYGCQVLVQREDEKALRKQVRKEEKRINKFLNRLDEDDDDDELEFDPVDLRTKRQAALANAMSQPVFSKPSASASAAAAQVESYPYVFDGLSKAKLAAGFIQGTKMALPSGFERKDDKKYEEVNIPASAPPPVEIGRRLKPIAELDEVGRAAFQNTKSLNRIQSVVYEQAYTTSENLLVCAPTGAGKTNVAMLCVVQAIRQNIQNGVIKKDAFKIVYVAPMKALAAEMTANFGKRLAPLGLSVRELTGDMQLTKTEIQNTQMLVTTPEKWDVVTRKPGDVSLAQLVRLLIIDEVHLLHGDRGPVVEALVARTLRLVERSQTVIRIVGLSATLPNYIDVAHFLKVNPYQGLFFFDGRFRPVPLEQTFIGIKDPRPMAQMHDTSEVCYEKVIQFLKKDQQVMVFVHARNATVKTALQMKELALNRGHSSLFEPKDSSQLGIARNSMAKSRNKQLVELFNAGLGCHHAGLLRSDRNLVEKMFAQGMIKVLVCTATLAWGVNLPAHAVIIKGTEIYDAKRGQFVDVGILDVLQIFGRAGRPQFDKSGHGTIITSHDKLSHYLSLLTNQFPIESNFVNLISDNLNAEISLGSVTSVDEGVQWLSYTYLYVRMRKNPLVYGINYQELRDDPTLENKRREIITDAARKLDKAKMIRFDERTQYLHPTDLGRTAATFYIKYDTVEVFNELLKPVMNEKDILNMLSQAQEFEQLKVRDDEMDELDDLVAEHCEVQVSGGAENVHGKVNILLQTHISRGRVNSFSLTSDLNYVITNAGRIARALFEIVLRKNWPLLAGRILRFAKTVERQMWDFETPLKQHPSIKYEILSKLESRNFTLDKLREMEPKEIGHLLHHVRAGSDVKKAAMEIPLVELDATIQPITRTVLRVRLSIRPNFRWNDRVHGATEPFWVWVEDPDNNHIYHHEFFLLSKKQVRAGEAQELVFTIPIFEPLPTQYYVRAISDRWLGSETYCAISFKHLILPERHPPHTDLLDLQPLPVTALQEHRFERLYSFSHFNPIQTQIFHTLYHSDKNVLLGAPTGSGKTIAAEIAMFKVFRDSPNAKVVYIAPLKALVRERMDDWRVRIQEKLGKKVVELTGDVTPDVRAIQQASVIVTTPEKWDGISRSWQTRNYVQAVALIVIDEIHLLGEDRGPVLEVIVSRTNFISSHTSRTLRVIGLSTALANARDLADWLGIGQVGLFNFRPSVRPVPLEVHIAGFPGKHYCPRMSTMNKPTFQAIQQHSPDKPALVFVSSRRQTRITAIELISHLAEADNPKMWLRMDDGQMERITQNIKDPNLRLTLAFGIGMHHAGLVERDRKTVEELYVNQKIQLLIATATLAWGVNFPTHLVVIKGTEYYDGKQKRYVDMPITDVLQMMGRAGRPQYDDRGVACVLVHDVKKHFYKKFLYEPFPVESSLHHVLPDHLNAEIVAGTIRSRQDALDYVTWTYFFRRLVQNPSYYGLEGVDESNVNTFLTSIVDRAFYQLDESFCLEFDEEGTGVSASTLGRIASYYYLSHTTMRHFSDQLSVNMPLEEVLQALCDCAEYAELPVRHNEDNLNTDLAKDCPLPQDPYKMDSPHVKAHLLLQGHFGRMQFPCSDYYTDAKSVLDQAIRILQAMIDVSADSGWLDTTLNIQTLLQMIIQGRWRHNATVLTLPHIEPHMMYLFKKKNPLDGLPELVNFVGGKYETLAKLLRTELQESEIEDVFEALNRFPIVRTSLALKTAGGNTVDIPLRQEPQKNWIKVGLDQEYTLDVGLRRLNPKHRDGKVYAPRFPKPKDEGWFLVLGCVEDKELLALKRAGIYAGRRGGGGGGGGGGSQQHPLTFYTPEQPGRVVYTLYLMSDAYLGFDQQYEICLDVVDDMPGQELADEMDDDEARFALLQKERQMVVDRQQQQKQQKQQQTTAAGGEGDQMSSSKSYENLGARPKTKRS